MPIRLVAAGFAALAVTCSGLGWAHANPSDVPNVSIAVRPSPVAAPAGTAAVGRVDTAVTDADRTVIVSAWYPTTETGRPAPYIPATGPATQLQIAAESAAWLRTPGVATMAGAQAAATEVAPVAGDRLPVVLMSPGLACPRFLLSGLASDLASRGWVAVVMDHTGEAPAVELPDGRLAAGGPVMPDNSQYMRARLGDRMHDTRITLDRLPTLPIVGPHLDPTRIAMVGHSYGGLTAVQTTAIDPRVRAVVVLDGSAGWAGTAAPPTLDRPVLLLGSSELPHPSWAQFHDSAFDYASVRDGGHYTATDLCALGGGPDKCGTLPADRAAIVTRDAVASWLDRHLLGHDLPRATHPELVWHTG